MNIFTVEKVKQQQNWNHRKFFFQLRKEKSRKCFVKRREIRAGKEDRNIEAGTEVETMGEMLLASLLSYIA